MNKFKINLIALGCFFALSTAQAGPVIIDGMDANDHGSATTVNERGWLYMQRALENLANNVNPLAAKVVVDIGATSGDARNSITSAFNLSTLPGLGWSLTHVDGAAAVDAWLAGLSTSNTGILYLTTFDLDSGDANAAEQTAINNRAAEINNFVGGAGNATLGGALFAQGEVGANAFGWLSTLIPGITFTDIGGGGISTDMTLTPAGTVAFPGLTNTDLAGADPWHGYFSGNLGGLSVLATAPDSQGVTRNVIIGGGAGTILQCGEPGQPPCPRTVAEPSAALLILPGLVLLSLMRRRLS